MAENRQNIGAGRLNKVVTIQSPSKSKDSFGQLSTVWTTVVRTRAAIEEITASEKYAPGKFTTQISHTITLRYPGDSIRITTGMQVVYRTHTYRIESANNVDEGNRKLLLLCQELNSDE